MLQGAADHRLRPLHLRFIRMSLPRPEEAAKAIFFPARHDMHMQVRNALADTVVYADERAFRIQSSLNCASEHLNIREERTNQLGRQVF